MVIEILILFFLILILYPILNFKFKEHYGNFQNIIEGIDDTTSQYQPYDVNNPNNSLILGQQNAGNIQVLKSQVDTHTTQLNSLSGTVTDLSKNYTDLYNQVQSLVQQQQQYATQLNGGSDQPVTITGTNTN